MQIPPTRLTSRSDGPGKPLDALIAQWAARNPEIRRVWLHAGAGRPGGEPEEIAVTLELRPVGDSEETLAVWMAHCERWRTELEASVGRPVPLDWRDDDGATLAAPPGAEEPRALVYERAR